MTIQVVNRSGQRKALDLNRVTDQVRICAKGLSGVEPDKVALATIGKIVDGISTSRIDDVAAQFSHETLDHPDYQRLAANLVANNIQSNVVGTFSQAIQFFHAHTKMVDPETLRFITTNSTILDSFIRPERDFDLSYNSLQMLRDKGYLLKVSGAICETPQYMMMRVAIATSWSYTQDVEVSLHLVEEAYDHLSQGYYTHATPTIQNACTMDAQLSSCFLAGTGDSLEEIMNTLTQAAKISKKSGGLGIHFSNIRSAGALIKTTGGKSRGLCPQLSMYESVINTWDQGGKRKGACATFLEEWHGDFPRWMTMKSGTKGSVGHDLFYGSWVNDLFVKRVRESREYTLFSPDTAPGLSDVYDGMEVCSKCGWSPQPSYMKSVYCDAKTLVGFPWARYSFSQQCYPQEHTLVDVPAFTWLYEHYETSPLGLGVAKVDARKMLDDMSRMRVETGGPYVGFKDHVNRMNVQSHVGTIKGSNLCVAPETRILTKEFGQVPIVDVADQKVHVWNGEEWSLVTPRKTGDNQPLISVTLDNHVVIQCTKYHKFHLHMRHDGKYKRKPKISIVDAEDLVPGDSLIRYQVPQDSSSEDQNMSAFKYPYTHGFFCADGTYASQGDGHQCRFEAVEGGLYCLKHTGKFQDVEPNPSLVGMCHAVSGKLKPLARLYAGKEHLVEWLDHTNVPTEHKPISLNLPMDIGAKFIVPINDTVQTKLLWFAGFMDGDGTVVKSPNQISLQCTSIDKKFLMDIRLMLQTLGVDSTVKVMSEARQTLLPDGHGGKKLFDCKKAYRMLIAATGTQRLMQLGFNTHRLKMYDCNASRDSRRFIKVVSVVDEGRVSDTYCFTESIRNTGMFEGVSLGQCVEVVLSSDSKNYGTCTLGNIAVSKFVNPDTQCFDYEKLKEVSAMLTRRLDHVVTHNNYPVVQCENYAHNYRSIGIGIQGLADTFVAMGIPFDSEIALEVDCAITETIYYAALWESCNLAQEKGPFTGWKNTPFAKGLFHQDLWLKNQREYLGNPTATIPYNYEVLHDWDALKARVMKHGLRNNHVMAYAPTVSTSVFLNNNDSFEPFSQLIGVSDTLSGRHITIAKGFAERLQSEGLWTEEIRNQIIDNRGELGNIPQLQHLECLYKTVWSIKQKTLMERAALRGAFIDQSYSLNLFFQAPTINMVSNAFLYAHQLGLKTGAYYTRTRSAAKPMNITLPGQQQVPMLCTREDNSCSSCSN
jgi:ribonucleoside-diphosphate reductase alpha chain